VCEDGRRGDTASGGKDIQEIEECVKNEGGETEELRI
jgi:hypothetical protein